MRTLEYGRRRRLPSSLPHCRAHSPPSADPMQRAIFWRIITPALPVYPAASVRDDLLGRVQRMRAPRLFVNRPFEVDISPCHSTARSVRQPSPSALLQGQAGLGAVERLNLALLVAGHCMTKPMKGFSRIG